AAISVTDHGSGIPAEFQPRIFEKFAQADGSDSRNRNGTGLGLSIVRAIVERLGGTIGFTSRPGETRFRFTLPLPAAASAGTERARLRGGGWSARTIPTAPGCSPPCSAAADTAWTSRARPPTRARGWRRGPIGP